MTVDMKKRSVIKKTALATAAAAATAASVNAHYVHFSPSVDYKPQSNNSSRKCGLCINFYDSTCTKHDKLTPGAAVCNDFSSTNPRETIEIEAKYKERASGSSRCRKCRSYRSSRRSEIGTCRANEKSLREISSSKAVFYAGANSTCSRYVAKSHN